MNTIDKIEMIQDAKFPLPTYGIVLTVGVSGSGKTTKVTQLIRANPDLKMLDLNRDALRRELFKFEQWSEYKFTTENEALCTQLQINRAIDFLNNNKSGVVFISDTNINPNVRAKWESIAHELDVELVYHLHLTPTETIMNRNDTREYPVTNSVIVSQTNALYKKEENKEFLMKELGKYMNRVFALFDQADLVHPVVVDIDGTVADHTGIRSPFDESKVSLDKPRENVITVVRALKAAGEEILFCSGRHITCLDATKEWLETHVISDSRVFMRAADNNLPDYVVKPYLIAQSQAVYGKPKFFIDDRQQVVDMYRAAGFEVMQVAPGNF